MSLNLNIVEVLRDNHNFITTSQVCALGYSRTMLGKYVKKGLLESVAHGVYSIPGIVHDDMYALGMRSGKIVFSHDTALFLNGLSERTPFKHSITIPSNASLPASIKDDCICYYIKPELYRIGLAEKMTTFGNAVHCYNAERTICDLIRSRSRVEDEMIVSAVKNYAESNDKNLNLLAEYAEVFKVGKEIKRYLEVLL